MTYVNKFRVKDDLTTIYNLEATNKDGEFIVWWIDEDGSRESVDYEQSTVDRHLSSGNWVLADQSTPIRLKGVVHNVEIKATLDPEYTGGSSNYYKVFVQSPTTLDAPYEAECNDIIEALKMTFAEGNAFKAIWRKAKARQGVQKKGYDNGLYDSEKVVFFGERMVVEAKSETI